MQYQSKMPAYAHQEQALQRLLGQREFALLMAMRTGKTKVLLDDFGRLELAGKANDLLVIAPAGVYRTWLRAMDEHLSDDLRSRIKIQVWSSSDDTVKGAKEREEFLKHDAGPRVLLMNAEALSAVTRAKEFCKRFLRDRDRSMIAIDESTIIKNPRAKRTKFINETLSPKAMYRRILSGLPTPRSPLDLYSQFEFLSPRILGFKSYWSFRARYAVIRKQMFGGRTVDLVVGYQNTEELQHRIAPSSFRVEFRPKIPSTYTRREVTLTKEQAEAYRAMKEYSTLKLESGEHVTATIVITQILRLHQILCGFTMTEEGALQPIPESRTRELIELLDDYAGKAIIWCSYDYSIKAVTAALIDEYGQNSVARFWGGNVNTREQEEQQFLNNPECRFMIATPSAGGRGRTWSNADLVIYYSSTNNLEHRDQSEQRAQGVDKARQVDYIDLIVPGTVEEKILKALREKINMAAAINGDNYKEWLI